MASHSTRNGNRLEPSGLLKRCSIDEMGFRLDLLGFVDCADAFFPPEEMQFKNGREHRLHTFRSVEPVYACTYAIGYVHTLLDDERDVF